MFKTFILDADNGQIACTTKDRKVLKADDELQDLILEVLNEIYNDKLTRRLFKAKKYNIHYVYKGENKVASYDNFIDARRQHRKMMSYGDLYSAIFADFNTLFDD